MDEPTNTRAWRKPELTVLVRSGPEEVVLAGCKYAFVGGGNYSINDGCLVRNCTGDCAVGASS